MSGSTIKLNNPARAKRKAERIAVIRARIEQALLAKGCHLPEAEANALSEAAWCYENGAAPDLSPAARRTHRDIHNRVAKDAKRIRAALDALGAAIEGSCPATHGELADELSKAGITPDEANRVLTALQAVTGTMVSEPGVRAKQGNTVKPLAAWALALWPALDRCGMSMRASSRILAAALNGSDKVIYQTIRNSLSR